MSEPKDTLRKSSVEGNRDSLCQMESGRQAHLCGRGQEESRPLLTPRRENRPSSLLPVCLKEKHTTDSLPRGPFLRGTGVASRRRACIIRERQGKSREGGRDRKRVCFQEYQREENKFPPGLCCLTAGSNQREDGSGDGV